MKNKIISYYQFLWYNLCEYIIKHNLPNNYEDWDYEAIQQYNNICKFESFCYYNFDIDLKNVMS